MHSSAPFPTREQALQDCEKTSILTAAELDSYLTASAVRDSQPEQPPIVQAPAPAFVQPPVLPPEEATSILTGQQIMAWVQSGVRDQEEIGRAAQGTSPPDAVPVAVPAAGFSTMSPAMPSQPAGASMAMTQQMPQMSAPQMSPLAPQMSPLAPQMPAPQMPAPLAPQMPAPLAPQMSAPQMSAPLAPQMPAPPAPLAPQMSAPLAPQMPAPLAPQMSAPLAMPMTEQMPIVAELEEVEPESEAPNPDLDLFALPQAIADEQGKEKKTSLSSMILMGFFAVIGGVIALAVALPTQRDALQERLFPTAKPPALISVQVAPAIEADQAAAAPDLDEKRLAEAARALTEGRRLDALEIYQELDAAFPNTPLYSRLAHSLQVSEASK